MAELNEIAGLIAETNPYKVVLSGGKGEYRKIVCAKKILKGKRCY